MIHLMPYHCLISHSTRHTQVKKVSSSRTKKNRFSHGVVMFIEYKSVFSRGESNRILMVVTSIQGKTKKQIFDNLTWLGFLLWRALYERNPIHFMMRDNRIRWMEGYAFEILENGYWNLLCTEWEEKTFSRTDRNPYPRRILPSPLPSLPSPPQQPRHQQLEHRQ